MMDCEVTEDMWGSTHKTNPLDGLTIWREKEADPR